MEALHVIADDLTGACDVAAALLPWPGGVLVRPDGSRVDDGAALVVRNTQSRTLAPALAARRVRDVLGGGRGRDGIVLKKIDTGLRGSLGAEIDAAMEAMGAPRAFVLPAIPEVGRTTVGGEQRIDGVPVHRTAFASDLHNPVRESHVAAAIARGTSRRVGTVLLDAVRGPGGPGAALDALDASIVVLDAETDADLTAGVDALLRRPRPLLLVGSTGLACGLRAALVAGPVAAPPPAARASSGSGTLVVVGSAHPVARAQRDRARLAGVIQVVIEVDPAGASTAGARAAALLAGGGTVSLVAPDVVTAGDEAAVGAALRTAAAAALGLRVPTALVLVGGETAYEVLAGLGHPPLSIEGRAAPLAVRGRIADGPYRGVIVVTKGGSSGGPELLASLVREATGGAA